MSEKPVVHFDVEDGIGIITIDYPPVNALGPGVSDGIMESLEKGEADPSVKAFVLIGAGRTFIAGADIKGFGKGRPKPKKRTYDVLDTVSKPVVAAIHGYALGGGLENALACHYRIAVAGAKVGLPEVLIGVIPGGGGTQRLPRIVGPAAALDLIISGRHVPAPEAKDLGIIDDIVDGKDLRAEAIAYAAKIADVRPLPRVRDSSDRLGEAATDLFDNKRKQVARRTRGQPAVENAIKAVEAAVSRTFDEGIAYERELFDELETSDEAGAMRYAFFAEREVARLPGLPKDLALPEINTMAVVGAGTMGGGIAMSFRRRRHAGQSRRRLAGGPRKGHAAHSRQLRHQRQARLDFAGRDERPAGAHHAGRSPSKRLATAMPSSRPCSSACRSKRRSSPSSTR